MLTTPDQIAHIEYPPHPERPFAGVGVVVWREGQVLLVQRRNAPACGQWRLPGGRQRLGEGIEGAAIRTIREMTGVEILPIGVITALDIIERDERGQVEQQVTMVEVAAFWRGGEAHTGREAAQVRWVYPDALGDMGVPVETIGVINLSILQGVH
jgi:ADP-ribose pyrophosphatase YjhB (NUDIX family)